jgi:hypothetical protein
MIDAYESSRRKFLMKLGLTVGATIVASSALNATVIDNKEDLNITAEQKKFMVNYEKWMDEFVVVIRRQKENPDDYENNKNIVRLSEIAKTWQDKLNKFMTDENFARHYMAATQRMTLEIG